MDTFVGDLITLSIETGIDLTGYDLYIKYKKPNGSKGRWAATQCPTDDSVALYSTSESDLDQDGVWKLQVFADAIAFRGHGKIFDLIVSDPVSPLTTLAPTTAAP